MRDEPKLPLAIPVPAAPVEVGIEKGDGEVTAHNVELLLRPDRLPGETWLGYRERLRAARDWKKGRKLVSPYCVPEGNIPGKT